MNTETRPNFALDFYATPGPQTALGDYGALFDGLPSDVPSLVRIVQGLMLHIFWAERYGVTLPEARKAEVQLRYAPAQCKRILELDPRPLTEARSLECRLVGNCRDFSTLLTAILRYKGIPARARCGFATYFLPNHYEDHWVVEYWNAAEDRWLRVDAQLDAFQRERLGITFDTLDLPRGTFLSGGEAWRLCRAGQADPDTFGIFDMKGLWFVRGNLMRDFLALNKVEVLPWDHWGPLSKKDDEITLQEWHSLDHLAELCEGGEATFAETRALYATHPELHWPGAESVAGPQSKRAI